MKLKNIAVLTAVLLAVVGLAFFMRARVKQKPYSVGEYTVGALEDITLRDQDQGAAWKYNPILLNRRFVTEQAAREPQQAACSAEARQRSANAWLKWRRDVADTWATTKRITRQSYNEIMDCKTQLEALNLWNCFSNVRNFAFQATLRDDSHKLGFEVPDIDYYSKIIQYDPEALKLPNELKDGIPDNISAFGAQGNFPTKSYEGVQKINELSNWKVLNYHSRTVANPSSTGVRSYNRLIFLNIGPRYDKYIQFTVPPAEENDPFGNNGRPQQLVDFISVERIDRNGRAIEKPVMRFAQFWRDSNGRNPKPRLDFQSGQGTADQCYLCHPGGMRYLSPLPGSVTPAQIAALKTINDRMASYKQPDWGGAIHQEYYGPPRGDKIGCMDCHNVGHPGHVADLRRGPLNYFTDTSHIKHKLRFDMSMTVPRSRNHMAVISMIKGLDEDHGVNATGQAALMTVRKSLFGQWSQRSGSLSVKDAFDGSKKMEQALQSLGKSSIPVEVQPSATHGEKIDDFFKAMVDDQAVIEDRLFQQNDKRYQIETANWMELRCPNADVEADQ